MPKQVFYRPDALRVTNQQYQNIQSKAQHNASSK